ncbi:MAG TPA: tryptophan synthase subunit alpha [Bacteroidetes bacterium]|nr:tryptophan synthase subunit alpha [Bacteroidota bacterium]
MGVRRIESVFKQKKDVLSIYITAGYPELDSMPSLVGVLDKTGVDFFELGMPYSDPLADGPVIQNSSAAALKTGMNLENYFEQVKEARKNTEKPLLFMGYYNQIFKFGIKDFLNKCNESGIDGLIIPDLPPDIYSNKYNMEFEKFDLGMIFLITPTTSDERIKYIDELSNGFIYAVSTSSTTGKEGQFSDQQIEYFKRIRKLRLGNPVVVGFGISNKEKYQLVNEYLAGAIIGSAFLKSISDKESYLKDAVEFVKKIKVSSRR